MTESTFSGGAGGISGSLMGQSENISIGKTGAPASTPSPPSQVPSTADPSGAKEAPQTTEPRLGAGGTSPAVDEPAAHDEGSGGPAGTASIGKAAGTAAAVPAAGAVGQIALLAMFVNYLKGLAMTLMALGGNLLNMAMGLLLSVGKTVMGGVMGVGTMISTAVGGAVSAMTAGVGTFVAGGAAVALVIGTAAVSFFGGDIALKDAPLADCRVQAAAALDKVDGSGGAVDDKTAANARTTFSVLSAWGMPNENIAGILGNWDAESGIDPTSVQNHFKSPHEMTEVKREAATNTNNGIGLGQWTFGRNANLREYATGHGEDWWSLTMQLGFMLSAAEGSDAGVVKDMIANSYGTPATAAIHFHDAWERSADTAAMRERRATYATTWMGMFGGWEKDQALADSILAQAGATVDGANSNRAEAVRSDCVSVGEEVTWVADGTAPGPWGGHSNGGIPSSQLTQIPWATSGGGRLLRSDATKALIELNGAFRAQFGYDMVINDAYRDLANQIKVREEWCAVGKCQNAATPGTSNHGWALAIDIGVKSGGIQYTSPEYLWLKKNAGRYGWVHPAYMEPGGTGPFEPWHWEYYGVA